MFDQIGSPRVRLILGTLENATSSYCTPFARLCREVFAAREEANDNEKYLRTMEPWIYKIKCEENFSRLGEAFRPLLHTIVLVWKHSNFYNEPSRLVGIMRQVCNLLIDRARRYVSGEQLFRLVDEDEANVAVQRLRTTPRAMALRFQGEARALIRDSRELRRPPAHPLDCKCAPRLSSGANAEKVHSPV